MMKTVTITEILDDLRSAEEIVRQFERQYWLSSADFHNLYQQGLLDNGENLEDFTLWSSFYQIKQLREKQLQQLSQQRLAQLPRRNNLHILNIPEPVLTLPIGS